MHSKGFDKSGKATQSKLLAEYLRDQGYHVEQSEFHNYSSPTGKLIQQWLYGEYDVDQPTIELIMSADKQAQQNWFKQLEEEEVDFLILDRYTASQIAYAMNNNISAEWTNELQRFMRQPDVNIIIDLPAEESMQRKGQHGANDRYESNKQLLQNVRDTYINSNFIHNRRIVNGRNTIKEIHTDIIKIVQERFNLIKGEL